MIPFAHVARVLWSEDKDQMNVLGVILAGGFNRRMGAPKHALRARDGRSFAEVVRAAVAPVVDDRLLVIGPDEVLPDLPHALDEPRGRGPLAGIDAAFAALPRVAPEGSDLLIVPCDAPRLTSDLLRRLLVPTDRPAAAFGGNQSEAIRLHPLPIRLAQSAADCVRARLERGELALHALLEELSPQVIRLESRDTALLANINTPAEYEAYLSESSD